MWKTVKTTRMPKYNNVIMQKELRGIAAPFWEFLNFVASGVSMISVVFVITGSP